MAGLPGMQGLTPLGIAPEGGPGGASLQNPYTPAPAAQVPPPSETNDPVLDSMMYGTLSVQEKPNLPDRLRDGYVPMPDQSDIEDWAIAVERSHMQLLQRMGRDLTAYRLHDGGVPRDFNPDKERRVPVAALSNLVNKLSNLMAGAEMYVEAPWKDAHTEDAAQAIENYCYHCQYAKRLDYARDGGADLQRDKFWYLFLYGRAVARILPDPKKKPVPFNFALLDPASCFPIWSDGGRGMEAMVRKYRSNVQRVLKEYGKGNPKLEKQLMDKMGYKQKNADFLHHEGMVLEWWDTWNRALYFQGVELFKVPHKFGIVPFVYVPAVGEPKGLSTPLGRYQTADRDMLITRPVNFDTDLAEKGVSVFHYLLSTHRLREAVQTILYAEVEKIRNPPTITYSAPHLMGKEPPPLEVGYGGNNQRIKELQDVQGIPTSPRPTDLSPLIQGLESDWFAGSMNPAGMGMEMGANASGYSLDTLVANAKDLTVPYVKAAENFDALVFEIELKLYQNVLSPLMSIMVPGASNYGPGEGSYELTSEMIDQVGTMLKVEYRAIGPGELAKLVSTAGAAQASGLMSQKYAMDYIGVRDPKRMFQEILTEKGMQHPKVLEMEVIPKAMIARGEDDLAHSFLQIVVMPELMSQMGLGGGAPGGGGGMPQLPGGGGGGVPGESPGGVNQTGAPQPQAPGGPLPGQGRS